MICRNVTGDLDGYSWSASPFLNIVQVVGGWWIAFIDLFDQQEGGE